MSLFTVPGWSAPERLSGSDKPTNKKRKRTVVVEEDAKVQAATLNLEKLMKKLDTANSEPKKQQKKKNSEVLARVKSQKVYAGDIEHGSQHQKQKGQIKDPNITSDTNKSQQLRIKAKEVPKSVSKQRPKSRTPDPNGLTRLQSSMKASLEGARFRHFNELLYKSNSEDAQKLVHQDPSLIDDYHAGFRHQVQSWPVNPVNQFIAELGSMKQPLVIADLGCGDAAIARQLVPRGVCVLSFDLKSDDCYVVEADICQRVPLPGSELEGIDGAQVADVVVCALSLMSTNWMGCIREAWRILKPGGNLKIAEVTSRFDDVDAFVELIKSAGFNLTLKDDSNTHFLKFDFIKVSRGDRKVDWKTLGKKGRLLKPCEYKRR